MLVHIPSKKVPMSPYPQDDFTRHYFKRYGVTLLGNRLLHLVLSELNDILPLLL